MPTPASPIPEPWPTLIGRILADCPDALDLWYRREWPSVYRLCTGLLADHSAAEDAAQDSMLRLRDRLGSWNPERAYEPWRSTVVLNLCRDHLRKSASRTRAESALATRPLPSPAAPSTSEVERAEIRAALESALAKLPAREREAFVLRDLEDFDTRQVAEVMQVGASTVRSLLTLARRRLRDLLAKRLPDFTAELL